MTEPLPLASPARVHRQRRGLARLWHAAGHSLQGLRDGWAQPAFRQEVALAMVLLPAAGWLGRTWVEACLLAGSVVLVLLVELLNSAVEAAIDRIGPQWHALSRQAKDMASAAVLLALAWCLLVWGCALGARLGVA